MANLNTSWADLPFDIAVKIAGQHITLYEDLMVFGRVCWNWRRAMKSSNSLAPSRDTPWLMLAEPPRTPKRQLYNLRNRQIRHVELPEPPLLYNVNDVNGDELLNLERLFDSEDEDKGDWRYFSSKGWLISVTQFHFNITLVNPFTGETIQASRAPYHIMHICQGDWDQYFYLSMFRKFCLSHSLSPSSSSSSSSDKDDFTLVMLSDYSCLNMAFWRSGDHHWTLVDPEIPIYSDVIYYKDEFYCITFTGVVHALGKASAIGSSSPRVVADLDWPVYDLFRLYLVESNGSLLAVFRQPLYGWDTEDSEDDENDSFYETHYLNVWDVNVETGEVKEVNNLGNRALFLGWNSSFSLEASPARGCLPNCIYYTDDFADFYTHHTKRFFGGSDMGVYDLTSRSKIYDYYDGPSRFSNITPPLWLEPSHPSLQEAK